MSFAILLQKIIIVNVILSRKICVYEIFVIDTQNCTQSLQLF